MKKILVPTDYSYCANNATDFAVQSAKIFPAEITLMHSIEIKDNIYTDYMGLNKEFTQTLLNDMHHKLSDIKRSIEETEGLTVHTKIITKAVKAAIQQAIIEGNFDLVVMGTLGAGGIKEKIWGTNTGSVIGHIRIPLMVVPYDYSWKKPQKILFATNHFEKEPAILDFLFELAGTYMAQVHVVVFTDTDRDEAITMVEHARNISPYGDFLKKKYREETLTVTHLYGKDFEEVLQEHIRKNEIDVLAMVPYKKNILDSLFRPSITKKMSYHTTIPLLVIPSAQIFHAI